MEFRRPFRLYKDSIFHILFIQHASNQVIEQQASAGLDGTAHNGSDQSRIGPENQSLCQVVANGGNDPGQERSDPVPGAEQLLGFPSKGQGNQGLDDDGSRSPHGRSQEISQSPADGCCQEGIGLGQEGSCHVDQGIAEMQIAAIGAHGDMADIGREQTDEPGEEAGQDQQPEPFLWIPSFHEQSIPFNII